MSSEPVPKIESSLPMPDINHGQDVLSIINSLCPDPSLPDVYLGTQFEFSPELPSLVLFIGPSGAGKDTLTLPITLEESYGRVITATTRGRRYKFKKELLAKRSLDHGLDLGIAHIEDQIEQLSSYERSKYIDKLIIGGWLDLIETEPRDAYIWLRPKKEGETQKQYQDNLIREYDLVESDFHHGNFYGTPRASLESVTTQGKIPTIRTESAAAETFLKNLNGSFNVLVIGVLPDNYERMWLSVSDREDPVTRFYESVKMAEGLSTLAHLLIHNRWGCIEQGSSNVRAIIQREVLDRQI